MDDFEVTLDPDYGHAPKPNGYRRLAIAVLTRAIRDFAGLDHDDLGRLARVERIEEHNLQRRADAALTRVRRQIMAGEFLFERTDAVVLHWWRLAGEDPAQPKATRIVLPETVIEDRFAHMAELRETRRALEARGAQVTRTV